MRDTSSITVGPTRGLRGTLRVPSDKSITHRALFFGSINQATTTIVDPSPADDCRRTLELLRALGRDIDVVDGTIVMRESLESNDAAPLTLDCGNSGTTARLAMGLLAAEAGHYTLVGDASLERRPMERVAAPLRRLGATIDTTDGTLPVVIEGAHDLVGGDSHGLIAIESAQVHAALVLAALRSRAGVTLFVARPIRDHTMRMLATFGCDPLVSDAGVHRILPAVLQRDVTIDVPGDFSSAAFLVTAAILVPDSEIVIENVGLNPTRIAFLHALVSMGADVAFEVFGDDAEPRGRIIARYSEGLHSASFGLDTRSEARGDTLSEAGSDPRSHAGGDTRSDASDDAHTEARGDARSETSNDAANDAHVEARGNPASASVAEMIDELPLLALVATRATGVTIIRGAAELRVKESDRIAATAAVLTMLGASVRELEDGFEIEGPQTLAGGGVVATAGDHRLAMMAAIGALVAEAPTVIEDPGVAAVSYPRFWSDLAALGGSVHPISLP